MHIIFTEIFYLAVVVFMFLIIFLKSISEKANNCDTVSKQDYTSGGYLHNLKRRNIYKCSTDSVIIIWTLK